MSKKFLAIVDPWAEPLEHDAEKYPMLEPDNNIQCQLILNQLSRLKPLFDDIIVLDTGNPPHPLFDELSNYGHGWQGPYLSDKQDWDMWLCGFHYGRCIHYKINEVIEEYGWDYSRFNIIQNLSFMFPEDTKDLLRLRPIIKTILNIKEYNWDYVGKLTEL
tara:strand:+ start:329 stop:811 length:483 start_codon:yes stop_codon:yes gene_type:complete